MPEDTSRPLPVNGVVVCQLSRDDQTLQARWYHSDVGSNLPGAGVARRVDGQGFEGSFDIEYFDAGGKPAGSFRLLIGKQGEVHYLQWLLSGRTLFNGLGIEGEQGLAAAWNHV
jgi:hypothetical protein